MRQKNPRKRTPNTVRIENGTAYILLTGGEEVMIDEADLPLVADYHWVATRTRHTTYAQTFFRRGGVKETTMLHNMIMPPTPGLTVDHIHHNGLDNRRSELRLATRTEQQQNRRGASRNSATGIRGVSCYRQHRNGKQTYSVQVISNGKTHRGGHFPVTEEGLRAAEQAAVALRRKLMPFSLDAR